MKEGLDHFDNMKQRADARAEFAKAAERAIYAVSLDDKRMGTRTRRLIVDKVGEAIAKHPTTDDLWRVALTTAEHYFEEMKLHSPENLRALRNEFADRQPRNREGHRTRTIDGDAK